MKRTKQRADRGGQAKPEHTSGCRQFEGEDLSKWHFYHKSLSKQASLVAAVTLVQQRNTGLTKDLNIF